MKYFNSHKGYALFLTLLIIVIVSIMFISLVSLVQSGAKRTTTREHYTQATELSEKGLQHITSQINKELRDSIGEMGIERSNFEAILLSTLNKYMCNKQKIESGPIHTGSYEVCIEKIEEISNNDLKRLVTFRSKGSSKNGEHEMIATYEIGSGAVPEVLKYAVATNLKSNHSKNGEGNLLLHGGVDIYGDLKVDNNLITYDKGTGSYQWINSILPRIQGVNELVEPRLVIGNGMYKIKKDPYKSASESAHQSYLNNDNFNTSTYQYTTDPKELFDLGYAPKLVNREANIASIKIKEQRNNFYFDQNSLNVKRVNIGSKKEFNNYRATNEKIVPYIVNNQRNNYNIETTLINHNQFNRLALLGGGHIRDGTHIIKDGLYVKGNLKIGNMKQTDDPRQRDNITLDGKVYVDGKVLIQGANLTSNVMMYVDGDVEIRYSSIQGKKLSQTDTGTLIIFATGNIFIANNSVQQDTPSHIKGYFYSEKNMEIYGVGSNIHIDGGIAANRVVLNAIRGSVKPENKRNSLNVPGVGVVESVQDQRYKNSRLTIKYDTELIEHFLKLNPPEPVIYHVDPPELISRETNN